jgi:hypothetical protein
LAATIGQPSLRDPKGTVANVRYRAVTSDFRISVPGRTAAITKGASRTTPQSTLKLTHNWGWWSSAEEGSDDARLFSVPLDLFA